MEDISRRTLIKGAVATGAFLATGANMSTADALAPKWPGHKPGKVYLGYGTDLAWNTALAQSGPIGEERIYLQWTNTYLGTERNKIVNAITNKRIPWVSSVAPATGTGSWANIANGGQDTIIRNRARTVFANLPGPMIWTFHHEPAVSDGVGPANAYVDAIQRVWSVMSSEIDTTNIAHAPILTDWYFDPRNGVDDPGDWVTPAVLAISDFVAVDPYQNHTGWDLSTRLPRVTSWLDSQGYPEMQAGVGECGSCNFYLPDPNVTAVQWWNRSWAWIAANTNRVGVVNYFNSNANNHTAGANWRLNETTNKLNAYKASLASPVYTSL